MSLEVRPVITARLEHRKASSDCCGAGLRIELDAVGFTCAECGQPCARILGPPVEVIASG